MSGKLVAVCGVLAALAVAVMFFAWGVAIWQPWGHKSEWKNTALMSMIAAIVLGFAAGLIKDFGGRR